jgi:hypothetical protein
VLANPIGMSVEFLSRVLSMLPLLVAQADGPDEAQALLSDPTFQSLRQAFSARTLADAFIGHAPYQVNDLLAWPHDQAVPVALTCTRYHKADIELSLLAGQMSFSPPDQIIFAGRSLNGYGLYTPSVSLVFNRNNIDAVSNSLLLCQPSADNWPCVQRFTVYDPVHLPETLTQPL